MKFLITCTTIKPDLACSGVLFIGGMFLVLNLNGIQLILLYNKYQMYAGKKISGKNTYLPSEFTSGRGTKQEATIQQIMAIKAMVSAFDISICKYFFIIKVLNCL